MTAVTLNNLKKELSTQADPKKAVFLAGYFKTGAGEYGAGDIFLGITVPAQRKIAHAHAELSLKDIEQLLRSKIHEHRLTALEILVYKYENLTEKTSRKKVVDFYLGHTAHINNWDLVDATASYILGDYLLMEKKSERKILHTLAVSKNIWERRIAIVATYAFIRNSQYEDTLKIAALLLNDKHDLIHKAVGWMLREVGKKSTTAEQSFLDAHAHTMPRTMLRYAIEKFPKDMRSHYLSYGTTRIKN